MGLFSVQSGATVDGLIGLGQSNMEGKGSSAASPSVANGSIEIRRNGTIQALADPVDASSTGSLYPAFANEWFTRTGKPSAVMNSAFGNTSLLPNASGNWSPNGANRSLATANEFTAWRAISDSSSYHFGQRNALWLQGENDAGTYNGTTITDTLYTSALENLFDYFDDNLVSLDSIGVITIGTPAASGGAVVDMADSTTIDNFSKIRRATALGAAAHSKASVVYEGTASYDGLGFMGDTVHYNQDGLDEIGRCAARRLSGNSTAPTVTAPYLSTTAYIDVADATKTSRTEYHTTGATTSCVIVPVVASLVGATTAFNITATYGGVAMILAGVSSTADTGRVRTYLFYINEDVYGGTISSETATITVASSASVDAIHFAAIEAKDAYRHDARTGNANITAASAASHNVLPMLDALVVTVSGANAATATTCSLTNATEVVDANILRTSYVQFTVGYSTVDAGDTLNLTHTYARSCAEMAIVSAAFRAKIDGEG